MSSKKPAGKKPIEKKPADKKQEETKAEAAPVTKEKQKPYIGTVEPETDSKKKDEVPETLVKPKAKKTTEKKEERHHRFVDRIEYAATLTLAQKYDDETIKKMVDEKFPGYAVIFNQKEIGRTRWMIKHDMLHNVHANGKPFDRCFLIDGKIVPRSEKPKTKYSRKPKYTPETDPLAKVAGVNVHDKKPAEKKPVKKPIEKKPTATAKNEKKE